MKGGLRLIDNFDCKLPYSKFGVVNIALCFTSQYADISERQGLSWLFGVLAKDEYRVVSAEAKGV